MKTNKIESQKLLARLERYREAAELSKSELARRLGCRTPETYMMWLSRKSLPSAYVEKALIILGERPVLTDEKIDLLRRVDSLSDEDRELVYRFVKGLSRS